MPELQIKNDVELDISKFFDYFDKTFTHFVKNFVEEFWEQNFSVKLVSITKNSQIKQDKISLGETYFAKSIPHCSKNVTYRFNSTLIKIFLEESLGVSKEFNLANLTEFEIYLLSSFANDLNKIISENYIPIENISKKDLKTDENWNLVYWVKFRNNKLAKLAISIPTAFVEPREVRAPEVEFNVPDNFKTQLTVRAGSTRLMLNDLKSLTAGDIVLLENSLINKMTIKSGEFLYDFKVNPNPDMVMELDEEQHDIGSNDMNNQNMWDDIQIEVSAEFDKVKMTLGELKQITNGMVIDLMDAFNGKISLVVEDKTVAKGDLVIINDRYGVKLTETYSTAKPQAKVEKTVIQDTQPHVSEAKQMPEDEFDYSDFDDEDN
ncbi:FliM/FliN family flagellar motor switch protein [bacterium]|nr:FliM/FliN family flagellar motor switch protein [bacterium]